MAGAASVQSLAGQTTIPASLLSNAINMAASLSNSSNANSVLTNSGKNGACVIATDMEII